MTLKYTVDSLDGIDENVRGLYAEKDGKFVLSVEGIPAPEDTSGLKTALERERANAKQFSKQVKRWEGLGKSPEEISELLESLAENERKKAEEDGDFDKLLSQHKTKWEKEKAELAAELDASRASERKAIIENSLKSSLVTAGATGEGMELLPVILSQRIKFETDGGERVIRILSEDGETPLAGSSKDGTATFEDLAKWAVEKYPSLFKGEGRGGGGKQPDSKAGRSGITKKSDLKTEKSKADFVTEFGLAAYKALPD